MSSASSAASDWSGAAVDRNGDPRGIRGWRRGGAQVGQVGGEGVEELACDVALEAADDLALGLAVGEASLGVGAGALAVAQAADGDHVQGARSPPWLMR